MFTLYHIEKTKWDIFPEIFAPSYEVLAQSTPVYLLTDFFHRQIARKRHICRRTATGTVNAKVFMCLPDVPCPNEYSQVVRRGHSFDSLTGWPSVRCRRRKLLRIT